MVGKIVTSIRMGKDGEIAAVKRRPDSEIPEFFRAERKLAASSGVRPDRRLVEMADGRSKG
jgi:hypothetical protein